MPGKVRRETEDEDSDVGDRHRHRCTVQFWRYQRYDLIHEYFEKPIFAYPPLSLLIYVWLFFKVCTGRKFCQVFKLLATTALDKRWTEYENKATYQHARTFVEVKYRLRNTTENASPLTEPKDDLTLQTQANTLNEIIIQMHLAVNMIQEQTKQMMLSMAQLTNGNRI